MKSNVSASERNASAPIPSEANVSIGGRVGRLAVRLKGFDRQPQHFVVFVQGANLSGQLMFDLRVSEGISNYSFMDALVQRGFGAVTFAIRGYGQSEAPEDPFAVTTDAAMEDLHSVIEWLAEEGYSRPHLLGFSWGGRIAGRYAEAHPDQLRRLVLYDPARGGGNLVLPGPDATQGWWINRPEFYAEKLEPAFTDPALIAVLSQAIVRYEPRAPNGIRLENATPFVAIDPKRVTNPTLMIYGVDAAGASYMQGGVTRADFFEQLATSDKAFLIIPDGGDFAHFQKARFRLYDAVESFLKADQ